MIRKFGKGRYRCKKTRFGDLHLIIRFFKDDQDFKLPEISKFQQLIKSKRSHEKIQARIQLLKYMKLKLI